MGEMGWLAQDKVFDLSAFEVPFSNTGERAATAFVRRPLCLGDAPHLARLVVGKRLDDLVSGVHHKRTVSGHRLLDGPARKEQDLCAAPLRRAKATYTRGYAERLVKNPSI